MGVYRAAKTSRPWIGGAWLVVLTIKPQLVPIVVIYLAARRCWRLLGCASGLLVVTVGITALALGPLIWVNYLRQVRGLEHFWGSGTPVYMVNVRGLLSRLIGSGSHVDLAAYTVWLIAMALVAIAFVSRQVNQARDARPAYAFAIAVALLSNPHLFMQDAVIWVVPLVLYAAAIRDAEGEWRRFVTVALLWPILFAFTGILDLNSSRLNWVDLPVWILIATTVSIGFGWLATEKRQAPSKSFGVISVVPVVD